MWEPNCDKSFTV